MRNKTVQYNIRILFWAVFVFVLLFLVWVKAVPNGKISYTYDFLENNHEFIGKLNPEIRVGEIINGEQKIIGNPVYFILRTPREFKTVNLKLKYKNPSNKKYPIIELGMLVDNTLWRYNLKAVQNSIIDNLALKWNVLFDDGVFLMQKKDNFLSLDEFFDAKVDYQKIAVYDYDLKSDFILPNYSKKYQKEKIDYGLRGDFQFFTYIKNEDLDFEFYFQDLNQNKDKDDVNINLYCQNELIATSKFLDDGNLTDNEVMSDERVVSLVANNLLEGVYKIELRVNDDIVVNSIKTSQKKISFLNKVRLNNGDNKVKDIYTDAEQIAVKIINPANLQDIEFSGNSLKINETYKQFNIKSDSNDKIKKINLKKNGVVINGNGMFVFSEDQYFDPRIKNVNANLDFEKQGIDYVLTRYRPNNLSKEWIESDLKFDLESAYSKNNEYKFMISVPGLSADNKSDDYLVVKSIKFELTD